MKLYGLTLEKIGFGKVRIKKILGLTIDGNLNFDDARFTLCKKADRKLSALCRISNYMSFEKKTILLKAFVELQMFHSRKVNFKIK